MIVERILVVFNPDGTIKGIASYAVNGAAEEMTAEAAAALLPHAELLAQVQELQARERANDDRVKAAEADRDEKVAVAENGRAAAEAALTGRDETIASLEARIAELTAPPASIIVSDRQFFQALAMGGKITEAEAEAAVATGTIPADMAALVDQLPADQQFNARMLLKGATTFRSDHPLSDMLAGLYGWSEEQKLDLFRVAAQL